MSHYIVGIIPVGITARDNYPLVRSRCHYKVLDVYTIAEVVQDYYSNDTLNRDVEYVFPLPPSAAVCSFKAVIDDVKEIKGIVKEKGEAKQEYIEAVAQGKTAGLLQQEHADVFRVSLGNIKPKQKISVHISFVSILPHDGSSPQSLRITMPTAIAPRYGAAPTNIPWFGNNSGNRFELTVSVQMSKPVTSVSSPSHPIGLTLGCAERELKGDYEPSKAFVHLGDSAFLDKDIVIVISAQGLDMPRCTVERWLASEGAEETTDAYALTLVPKFDLPALPNQEYIFLVDRSGSMGGGRMDAVKIGLQIMLRSLPSRNTTFNIVSFGSRYTSLWPKSQIYSAETVAEASKHVDTFTASYGGTELRSALQFAFSSRQAAAANSTERIPASVFVLTDGEAWDLDGIIELVTQNVEGAKKQDTLLRAFVLGVGNEVSTAMCEGIARAGRGSTVFVAEGEKPDAKLMSLLKAARGGVIEDLAVDWGSPEPSKDSDDDFELVSGPAKADAAPPKNDLPPLSLFDEEMSSADTAEVGPQKIIVQLLPPPVIQQAPKSDKLPIPLYPGFRCSIFAIIKQSSNPGPHSPSIKITGKVLGRDVVFQVPVTPIAIDATTTTKAMESGKLLHTLAAKALIQVYEDLPTSPETKAQIERLGKRYSLATSVTSFLAIDHESNSEPRPSQLVHNFVLQNSRPNTGTDRTRRQKQQPMQLQSSKPLTFGSQAIVGTFSAQSSPHAPISGGYLQPQATGFYQARQQQKIQQTSFYSASAFSAPGASVPPPPAAAGRASSNYAPQDSKLSRDRMDVDETVLAMRSNIAKVAGRGERLDSLSGGMDSLSKSAKSFFFAAKKRNTSASSESAVLSSAPSPSSTYAPPAGSGRGSAPTPSGYSYPQVSSLVLTSDSAGTPKMSRETPLTLELIARAQQFDGSFPQDPDFLQKVCEDKGKPKPAPALLAGLVGDADIKGLIWATVLVLACLKRRFANEKDSWEMMAEKATLFVEDALRDMGVDGSAVYATLAANVEN